MNSLCDEIFFSDVFRAFTFDPQRVPIQLAMVIMGRTWTWA